jgi:hypothetical protein
MCDAGFGSAPGFCAACITYAFAWLHLYLSALAKKLTDALK